MKHMFSINGGTPLHGSVRTQGAKNAALPVMASALLLEKGQTLSLRNVPQLNDVDTMIALLESLGMRLEKNGEFLDIATSDDINWNTPASLVQKMRASSLVLGPLLAKTGRAIMPLPGGCSIGSRPIDLHLKGLVKMGATIELQHGAVHASIGDGGLKGGRIYLDFPSVGATENLLMAAVLANDETTIENAAREPEIVNLIDALCAMGARIEGAGEGLIKVQGNTKLHSAQVDIIPDRVVACTYLLAGVITNGNVTVKGVVPQHFDSLLAKFEEANVSYSRTEESVTVYPSLDRLCPITVKTLPYPGFPTDVQPQLMAALCLAKGTSIIKESIFEARYLHVAELKKMGANVLVQGDTVVVNGGNPLAGSDVFASDLRAGAALVLAGLSASGTTNVRGLGHILRGYEDFDVHLRGLGADVRIVEDSFGSGYDDMKGLGN